MQIKKRVVHVNFENLDISLTEISTKNMFGNAQSVKNAAYCGTQKVFLKFFFKEQDLRKCFLLDPSFWPCSIQYF